MKEGFFACPAGGAFAALFFVGLALWAFLDLLVVCSGVGLLAFPCFVSGLLALPLCGAALTFFAAAKKATVLKVKCLGFIRS